MKNLPDDSGDRIRALGVLRASSKVHEQTAALTDLIGDPELRRALERESGRSRAGVRAKRAIVGGAIALAGLMVAVPAVALNSWLARTGEFGDPTSGTEVDDTEWIDLTAPDAPEVVVEAYPAYLTLPSTAGQDRAIVSVSRVFARMSDGNAQEGLLTQTYEFFAVCAWSGEWLAAARSSDTERQNHATDWLSDPTNYPSIVEHDGGGVVDSIVERAEAGRTGDANAVEELYEMGNCEAHLEGVTQ